VILENTEAAVDAEMLEKDESGKGGRRPKCSRDALSAWRWADLAGGATDNHKFRTDSLNIYPLLHLLLIPLN
jgi:hypothetical protein